jgi:cytochrome c-type biogenesis protein CcmF
MWNSLPEFGTGVLSAMLVAACYTMAVALAAGTGRPRLLQAARMGAYGTIALVGLAVLCLAYAFLTHDFRLEYVAHYSDRTMTTPWLLAALWGGQDGSLLWWLFLTSVFCGACVRWLEGRYRELQPFVIATQMSVLVFLAVLMLFAANPFRTGVSGAPPDGAGLNYQLRNFYMIIHPPSLYIGFTSCAVPFSFAVAALATGRLDNEWIYATRKWMLFSWLFLSIGNALGMLWAYEELGWGGYWAWDPVENAAFLPWLTASAYVHSVMIQERRGMLRLWNVVLICLTFFLTYFGTFLTRSGLIASVHSFAQSGIGIFFVYYMAVIVIVCTALILWRSSKLRSEGALESALSREFAFLANNWILLSIMVFIAVATLWPRLSEWLLREKSTIGPTFYNTFIPPVALVLIFFMGTAPLLGWRKTSRQLLLRSFRVPVAAALGAALLHVSFGKAIGFPAFVETTPLASGTALASAVLGGESSAAQPIYGGAIGQILAWIGAKLPLITVMLVAYNLAVVGQELALGVRSRQRGKGEGALTALVRLFTKTGTAGAQSRRRYGGYIVHAGIAVMFLGFAGRAWGVDKEASLAPGESISVEEYRLTYKGPRTEVDHEKRMIFADVAVERHGRPVGDIHPSKYIYKASPQQPSTEVARYMTARNDLYVIVGMINPTTKLASFQIHVNPLVSFVWLGVAILIVGALVAMWPEVSLAEAGAFGYVRALGSAATMVMLSILLALAPSQAFGQQHEMKREGIVMEMSPEEKSLFQQLLCNCGTCPHEPLATCTCGWAHNAREEVRAQLAAGMTREAILEAYAKRHGSDAVTVRADKGVNRAIWAVPLALAAAFGVLIGVKVRSWTRRGREEKSVDGRAPPAGGEGGAGGEGARDEYDDKLDRELRELE